MNKVQYVQIIVAHGLLRHDCDARRSCRGAGLSPTTPELAKVVLTQLRCSRRGVTPSLVRCVHWLRHRLLYAHGSGEGFPTSVFR